MHSFFASKGCIKALCRSLELGVERKWVNESSKFGPNFQISENSSDFLKMCFYQNSLEKSSNVCSASCTKHFQIF